MRKLSVLLLIAMVSIPHASVLAAKAKNEKPPLLVIFGFTESGGAPVGPEITAGVIERVAKAKRFDMLSFNPEMPALTRAAMEHRISEDTLNNAWEWKNAAVIAGVLKAQYALCIKGSTADTNTTITLDLVRISGGAHWTTRAESAIAATEGSRQATARKNAISTAVSSAVSQIMLEAFETNEPLFPEKPAAQPEPATTTPTVEPPITPAVTVEPSPVITPSPTATPAPAPTPKPADTRDVSVEYALLMKQVDADQAKSNFGGALIGLRHAVNLMPLDPKPRLRLAESYAGLGMTAEAADECNRALLFAKDSAEIHNALVKLYVSEGALDKAADQCRELLRLDPKNMEAQMVLGDILWNQAKIDEALHTYQDALLQDPKNTVAHGRLQKLYAAKKMYPQALDHLLAIKVSSANDEPDASKRYLALSSVILEEFKAVQYKLQAARRDFEGGGITREECYQECKEATGRIEALAAYLSAQTAPANYRAGHSRGVLAVNLLTQASGYMVSYLETERQYYKDQSNLLEAEAITEMNQYAGAFGPGPGTGLPSTSVVIPAAE